ncbi:hypothetical protein ACFFQ5_06935 [Pseudomonas brassicacearum]|uniref:hypothetical protein n=1 Tax=Pseudomonas brassicacearum TaxID=930166 RepID=UPI00025FDB98|nr:hypothetical protein [Pseudomonas brassicacearum]EIK70184.1 hypothetical protein PflQ8_1317 [Pseudomonas fluorescens Q8r1-96]KAB0517740.1 hypothetical protein F7R20_30985 [Pseudomonas brassicacearum subsp. brassicacearum]NJP64509.1 hypothetical protein [Pseudomonas brassicacearum]QEO77302.1 hypothetical protein ELZ14_06965 [Pseudomonas brassicacearum]SDQ00480.1 hypothetical protein SAMN04490180_6045 [Pseudomonas brassicacearum]
MNNLTENAQPVNSSIYENLLSQFNYAPLTILYEYIKSLDTQDYTQMLKALMEKARQNDDVNRQLQAWRQESVRPNRSRFLVKLINHTDQPLEVGENDLSLNADEQAFMNILPWDIQALKFDFFYSRPLGSRSKDIFKRFIIFGDQALGFRFDFGLRVNTSFGVISPTLTPVRTNKVASIGTTPIKCVTRIIHSSNEEPYGFTVEITLS